MFCSDLIVTVLYLRVKQSETTYKSVKIAVNYSYIFDYQYIVCPANLGVHVKRFSCLAALGFNPLSLVITRYFLCSNFPAYPLSSQPDHI